MKTTVLFGAALTTGLLIAAAPALAVAIEACDAEIGVLPGTSDVSNVTLDGANALHCYISSINAQGGPNGNTGAFTPDPDFGTGWSLLAKVTSSSVSTSFGGVNYTVNFSKAPDNKSGTWSITPSQNVMLDLVFAMHAGGRTGSFLFDNQSIATSGENGTWMIKWFNPSGKEIPDYSNLTLFARDQSIIRTPVPEPETYAMLLAGLGVLGALARRRKPV